MTPITGTHHEAKLRAAQLRAELQAIEAAEQAREQAKADAVRKAQVEQDARVLDRWRDEDQRVQAEGEQALTAAKAAARAGDVLAAFDRYTRWQSTRAFRNLIRQNAQSAASRLGIVDHSIIHLTAIDYEFAAFLDEHARDRVLDLADEEYRSRFDGTYPTHWDDLTPEQQAAAGLDEDQAPEVEAQHEDTRQQ